MNADNDSHAFPFDLDLGADEMRRRAEVVRALGADWDPAEALRGEQQAEETLYSDLDDEQQRIYERLVDAGVLPDIRGGRDAA